VKGVIKRAGRGRVDGGKKEEESRSPIPVSQDTQHYLPFPKFLLGGHRHEVSNVDWSSRARYIVTIDQNALRVWEEWEFGRGRLVWAGPERIEMATPPPLPTPEESKMS